MSMLITFTNLVTGEVIYEWDADIDNKPLPDCKFTRQYDGPYGLEVQIDWARAIFGEQYAFYDIANAVQTMQSTHITNTFFEMFQDAVFEVIREGHRFVPGFELGVEVTMLESGYELGYGEFFGVDDACGWKE